MNIDYVIISSDNNPLYLDFYEPVSTMWKKLGFKVIMIHICDEDKIEYRDNEIYIKIKAIEGINTGFQSQIARLFIFKQFKDNNLLISDIDMLPMNKDYFNHIAKNEKDDKIIIYSGQPYDNVPYFPMCYILANGELMTKVLGIQNLTFKDFSISLKEKYKGAWNTDEHFFYDQLMNNKEILIIKERDFKRRVDRGNWKYTELALKHQYYIDSHLIRPYSQYKNEINALIEKII